MANVKERSNAIKLSAALLAMMSGAALREDRCLTPTAELKGALRRKTLDKLSALGMAREVRSKTGIPVWRRDNESGIDYSLKLTAAGLRAVPLRANDERVGQAPGTHNARDLGESAVTFATKATTPTQYMRASIAAPRPGSKIADVLDLLARADGASIEELIAATGWLPHTTRAALTGLRRRGYVVERSRENATTRYRVAMVSDVNGAFVQEGQGAPDADDDAQGPSVVKPKPAKAKTSAKPSRSGEVRQDAS